jgi:poly(hydroxyalkanoate) depolymerase family esterase
VSLWIVFFTSPASAAPLPGTELSGTFENASGSRRYEGYVPTGARTGTPLPLVVALHGCTQTASDFRDATRLDELAETEKFITVYPEQPAAASPLRCWSWFSPAHQHRGRGEPALIEGITEQVAERWAVDATRVYVTGLSAGGAMAVVMGAAYPHRYAAIAVHSGCQYGGLPCSANGGPDPVRQGALAHQAMGAHARVVPVIVFQGDADTTVPPINAEQVVQQWISTNDYADDGTRNGSVPTRRYSTISGPAAGGHRYDVDYYVDQAGAPVVERWLVRGMGHAWSGGCVCEPYTDPDAPDATAATYAFFEAHPKP